MIRYCRRCVMPETKPDILFDDEGVCSACRHFERPRRGRLGRPPAPSCDEILDRYRSTRRHQLRLHRPGQRRQGQHLPDPPHARAGHEPAVRHGDDRPALRHRPAQHREPQAARRRLRRGHDEPGRAPAHQPARARRRSATSPGPSTSRSSRSRCASPCSCGVPLIVWGENSQNEYGGPAAAADGQRARPPLARGVRRPARPARVATSSGQDGIERTHLIQYTYPTDDELARVGVTGIFLGYYLPWDGLPNALSPRPTASRRYPHAGRGLARQLREPRQRPDRHPRLLQVPEVRLRPGHRPRVHARPPRPPDPRGRARAREAATTASSRGPTSATRSRRSSARSA